MMVQWWRKIEERMTRQVMRWCGRQAATVPNEYGGGTGETGDGSQNREWEGEKEGKKSDGRARS
jgi:hypothetical protein